METTVPIMGRCVTTYVAHRIGADTEAEIVRNLRHYHRQCKDVEQLLGELPVMPALMFLPGYIFGPAFLGETGSPITSDKCEEHRKAGMALGLRIVALCDRVRVFPSWEANDKMTMSQGMEAEVVMAFGMGKPVYLELAPQPAKDIDELIKSSPWNGMISPSLPLVSRGR